MYPTIGLIIIVVVVLFVTMSPGMIGANKLQNKKNAVRDAQIKSIDHPIYGPRNNKVFFCNVIFTDGTQYRERCSKDGAFNRVYYNTDKQPEIIQRALAAHKEAVEKNEKNKQT